MDLCHQGHCMLHKVKKAHRVIFYWVIHSTFIVTNNISIKKDTQVGGNLFPFSIFRVSFCFGSYFVAEIF